MTNTDFNIALRNYAGVPVIDLVGEINKKTLATLDDVLNKLVSAGHYNVMINVKRVGRQDLAALSSLEKLAKTFQTHYGKLDLIAELDQIASIRDGVRTSLANIFGLCTSEGQALRKIRRLPTAATAGVTPMSARLTESL